MILSTFNSSLDSHLAQLGISPQVRHAIDVQRIKLAGIQLPADTSGELQAALKRTIDEAFVSGFRLVSLICAGLALAGALCAWLMIEGKSPQRTNGAVEAGRERMNTGRK